MQTLATLFDGIVEPAAFTQHGQARISGVFDDSRCVQPDGVFVALRGSRADGRRFIADAVARGARVVVGEDLDPSNEALFLSVDDARVTLGRLAARWHGLDGRGGSPGSRCPKLVAVTGTNGKTTTAHLTREILRAAGLRCGMLGTVQYDLCGRSMRADLTTPGPLQLAAYLRESADAGAEVVVVEVSSHALDQRRVDGLRFAAAAFTNLTRDHLDYHGSMQDYARAKARLFLGLDRDATAVVNVDDAWHGEVTRQCRARIVSYALEGGRRAAAAPSADLTACVTRTTIRGTVYELRTLEGAAVIKSMLIGRHNVQNALAAAGLARSLGVGLGAIESGLAAVCTIPGRLQRVPGIRGFDVFVDYAHTPDALRSAASVLRPVTCGRLIVVFGCGGDRDRGKRPLMARVAAEFADAMIVTSDNPRGEDPQRIIDDALAGIDGEAGSQGGARVSPVVRVEGDRRRAIVDAIDSAREGDVVLIAGKGHEDYQIVGNERLHFDDVEVAMEAGRAGRNAGVA